MSVQAACGESPTVGDERRAGAKRTENIHAMSVTLDMSRLNGWLNAVALCRAKVEGQEG